MADAFSGEDASNLDQDSINRLRSRLLRFLTAMSAWCRGVGCLYDLNRIGQTRPLINYRFEVLLGATADDLTVLFQSVLHVIPRVVQDILGREQIAADDLMELPRIA